MIKEIKIRKELAFYSSLIYSKGLASASGGNISYKIREDLFLISPTNSCLGRLHYNDFIKINRDLEIIYGNSQPSKESLMHIAVYEKRNKILCVIHTHPIFTTSFSIRNAKIPMVTVSAKLKVIETPLVGYTKPGSLKLKEMVKDKLTKIDNNIMNLLLCCHGLLTFGESIESAFNTAELVEDTAKIAYYSSILSSLKFNS